MGKRTHRWHANERRAHAGVKTSPQPIAGNAFANNVYGRGVDTALSGLKTDLHKSKRMAHDDGAETTEATGSKSAGLLGEAGGCASLGVVLWFRSGRNVLELVDDASLDGGVWSIGGGHVGGLWEGR